MRFNSQDELSRRQFMLDNARRLLGVSAAPMLGAGLASPALAKSKAPVNSKPAKSVIFLNMRGGMSHLDTFDIKSANKQVNSINTAIGGYKVAHYLPETAKVLGEATVINSMTSKVGAHPQGEYLLHKGYTPLGTIVHPALGSWVTKQGGRLNEELPGYVAIGSGANTGGGWMGANYSAALVENPEHGLKNVDRYHTVSKKDFDIRLEISDRLNKKFHGNYATSEVKGYAGLFDEAVKVMNSSDLAAFDLNRESSKTRDSYGRTNFGQGCLLARRLVEVGVRYVEVTLDGWDTHSDNFTVVQGRCIELDKAYASLIKDLKSKGLLDSTLVVLTSEFGRSAEVNGGNGRTHHAASFSTVLAGGGVNKGMVYGRTSSNAMNVESDPMSLYDLNTTIAYSLGLDPYQVAYSPSKRPFRIAGPDKENGKVHTKLFS